MRSFLALIVLAMTSAVPATAQEWPTRTVTMIVGFGPGSTPDVITRLMAENLQERLGQPFVVDNQPGAGGNIALDAVAKADPDGYTIGTTIPGPLIVNPMIMDLMYDPKTDIKPITILATQPSVLVVSAELGVETLDQLIELLRENPGEYNYSSIGVGSISHLAMELVAQQSGTDVVHIPYESSPEAVNAVVAGETHMATMPPLAVISHAEAGNIKMLAVTTRERWPALPDVPTFAEEGLEGVQAEAWMALVAPAGTPDPVVDRLYETVKEILESPEVQEQMANLSFAPVGITPAEFAERIEEEEQRWAEVVEQADIRR